MSDHPPHATPPAIRVRDLTYRYPDGNEALRGLSFDIFAGECVALVGPNGAGKSTLLLHLNGLLPDRRRSPHAGHHGPGQHPVDEATSPRVWIEGLEVSPKTAANIRRKVGFLFQDPDDQLFCPTVIEDVAFGPLNQGLPRDEARTLAIESLERVGLRDKAERPPHHLSFGERKRACLAGILACRPSILVLDEPTANLDPRGRRRFIELIRSLEVTRLVATHDLEMVLEICPRSIVLDGGLIAADGDCRSILGDRALVDRHGLEVPLSLSLVEGRRPD
ncbi:energy-coupling factor ABC transporter ATP-binding protein [Aquisphaera insulae]|uniref:energy-coupling factor ABC transporter ATP-binding protein n=1 Tax=Aquisphaera insulae TaxID=2712864 RepID=UPI0013EB861E|nr:ABC transporter ATP-binding protein [Aquisphaera insulae]